MGEIHETRGWLLGAATGRRECGDTRRLRGITQTQLNLWLFSLNLYRQQN